jgi:hypothetical protein
MRTSMSRRLYRGVLYCRRGRNGGGGRIDIPLPAGFQTEKGFQIRSCMTIRVVSPGRDGCLNASSVYSES